MLDELDPYVKPPLDDLDGPPDPSHGRETGVEFGYRNPIASAKQHQACQACGEAVQIRSEHVRPTIMFEQGERSVIAASWAEAVFCDRACWTE